MTSALTSPLGTTPPDTTPWLQTTAQLVRQVSTTKVNDITAPVGISLNQFTDLVIARHDVEPVDLHQSTTILTKQVRLALDEDDKFESIRSLVIDPDRIATPDGRTAAEFCGESWAGIRAVADDRASAAIDGAERFGERTVIQLAILRTARAQLSWWGTPAWDQQVAAWSRTIRFAPKLKRAVRQTPELIDRDLLSEILGG